MIYDPGKMWKENCLLASHELNGFSLVLVCALGRFCSKYSIVRHVTMFKCGPQLCCEGGTHLIIHPSIVVLHDTPETGLTCCLFPVWCIWTLTRSRGGSRGGVVLIDQPLDKAPFIVRPHFNAEYMACAWCYCYFWIDCWTWTGISKIVFMPIRLLVPSLWPPFFRWVRICWEDIKAMTAANMSNPREKNTVFQLTAPIPWEL